MKPLHIRYVFKLPPDDAVVGFDLAFDAKTIEQIEPLPDDLPDWTALEFHQCSNCPLKPEQVSHCPLAARLSQVVRQFDAVLSHDTVHVEVLTVERRISQETTAQRAISALMGLVIATSGCPHTVYLKPMARFHLPLASEEETIYRATSMYLLAQYFMREAGWGVDFMLDGLTDVYRNLQIVNAATARRLRASSETDAAVNAIVLLDLYAKTMPSVIADSVDDIAYLFEPYSRLPSL